MAVKSLRKTGTETQNPTASEEQYASPEDAATQDAPPQQQAVARRAPADVAMTRDTGPAVAGVSGEWDENDFKFPGLKIVAGSGPLSAKFNSGSLVYADEEILAPPNLMKPDPAHAIRFIPIHLVKQYRENISNEEYQAGKMANIVSTKEEVRLAGGTTEWIDGLRPSYSPCATVYMLIERPEGCDHAGFSLVLDDKEYALAVYYASGTGYNYSARQLYNTALTSLLQPVLDAEGNEVKDNRGLVQRRPYLPKCVWTFRAVKRKSGDFDVWGPQLQLLREDSGPQVRDFLASLNMDQAAGA